MIKRAFLLALLLPFLAGCGRLAFMEEPLENFSAYYNTYYNAERSLEEGIRSFEDRVDDQPIDQDVFLSMFGRSDQASTQRQPFEDAVLKSSDLLRKYPESKWVDDAILIIGKAWFFTLNFAGAEQKFNEIFTLESPLHDEARFWLARTLIASGAYDEAFNHLQASLSAENVTDRWEPYYRLALAELHVQRENWEAAATELESGIDGVREKDLASRASFLLGQVYEQLEQPAEAIAAYRSVQSFKPFYELSYAAQFSAIRVQADHLDPASALQWLRQMERDDKNFDHRLELEYLRGRVLIAMGRYNEALDTYDQLLYDPNTRGANQLRGPVHYALGTYYRDVQADYSLASAYFDTAGQALQSRSGRSRNTSTVAVQPAPGSIKDGAEMARVFGSFSDVAERLAHYDSLMYLGALDDSSFQAFILELRQQRAEEMAETERELRQRQAESSFGGVSGVVSSDDRGSGSSTGNAAAGFLFHRDPMRMEQARQDFELTWGDRPLAVNWRRIAAIEALSEEEGPADSADGQQALGAGAVTLPPVDFSEVPRDEESWEQMRERRAMARYELANVLFLSMSMPDSALTWYRLVIDEDWDLPVAQRALYALAEVQTTLGDEAAAQGIYEVIIRDYPNSEFAHQAYERLGLPAPEGLITDSLGLAEQEFLAIEARWQSTTYDTLITDLIDLAVTWPNTEVAPRALFGASSTFMNWAMEDSLDILGPIPVVVADSVLEAQGYYPPETPSETPADSTEQMPEERSLTMETLLGQITREYESSLQFEAADRLLAALEEIASERKALSDSLAQALADSLALVQTMTLAAADRFINSDTLTITAEDALVLGDSALLAMPDSILQLNALEHVATLDYVLGDSLDLVQAESLVTRDSLSLAADSLVLGHRLTLSTPHIMGLVDSLTTAMAESLAMADSLLLAAGADSLALTDSLAVQDVMSTDSLQVQIADSPQFVAEPPQSGDILEDPSLGNIDWSVGGYTIFIGQYAQHEMAAAFIRNFKLSLSDIPHEFDIYGAAVQGGVEFRVGLGLFETLQDAEAVMQRAGQRLPGEAKVVFVRGEDADEEL